MEKLRSRKLWMSIVSAMLVIANDGLGMSIPSETVIAFAGIVMTYVASQGYVDSKK